MSKPQLSRSYFLLVSHDGHLGEKEIKYSEKLSKERLLRSIMYKSRDSMQVRMLKVIFEGFLGFIFFYLEVHLLFL